MVRESRPSSRRDRWAPLAGVWGVYFGFGLAVAAMAPLVAPIAAELRLSHAAMGGVLGAWPLVYIVSAIPCGLALDRFGVRWSIALAAAVIGTSLLLRAVAGSHLGLWLAVAVFGLGGPLVSVGGPKLIAASFHGKDRGLALGIYVAAPPLGAMVALSLTNSVLMPLVGGRWRGVLVVHAAVLFATAAAWLLLSAGTPAAVRESRATAPDARTQLGVFARLLAARPVQLLLLMGVGIFFFNHGLTNWLPEILRSRGMSATTAGYWASVPTAVGVIAGLTVPHLARPSRRVATLGALFVAGGAATVLVQSPPGVLLGSALLLQGVARGSMMAVAMLVLMDTREVGAQDMGAAGGLFFSSAEVGGVLGPLAVGTLYDWTGGFTSALHVLTGLCVALIALLWLYHRAAGGGAASRARTPHHGAGAPPCAGHDVLQPALPIARFRNVASGADLAPFSQPTHGSAIPPTTRGGALWRRTR